MNRPVFQFGNIVVVDGNQVGVIVKSWSGKNGYSHDVYVRGYNSIKTFYELDIQHYIYNKELCEEEREHYA